MLPWGSQGLPRAYTMSRMADFDAAAYLSFPQLDTAGLIALATKLVTASPKPLPEPLRRPVKQMRMALEALEQAYASQTVPPTTVSEKRKADTALDNAWGALHKRLSAWTQLPEAEHPEVVESRGLIETLFPEGLGFLTLAYEAEWAESGRRLRQIETQELGGALERLVGASFLIEVRRAHLAYGVALNVTVPKPERPAAAPVAEPHAELRALVRAYARKVVGLVDEGDEASVTEAQRALEPIADAKAAARRRVGVEAGRPSEEIDPGASD